MAKKVIQVPVDEELLDSLDRLSRKQSKARSELIRHACQRYLDQMETEELDRIYRQGYEKFPEGPEIGKIQEIIAGEVLSEESW
jgi:metal-responsive CopG/Arc/MetJ family transcriptional regulator